MHISVENLRFERDARPILQIPTLSFTPSSTTAIFGPNGSGKTTLLRILAGLEQPTEGRVAVAPRLGVRQVRPDGRPAFAFQEAVFVRGTVRYNLDLALRLRRVGDADRGARIAEVARECDITALLDRSARRLSRGEAQRVNLARALALRAPVTLLDEPLAGIDRVTRSQLLDDLPRLLATFASTTVLVTHDREEAFRLAEHLVILVDGCVRMAGPKRAVYEHPVDPDSARLLGYTVFPTQEDAVAVPPGGWRLGCGSMTFALLVDSVVDMGHHWHTIGTVDGTRVQIPLPPGSPKPELGKVLPIHPATRVLVSTASRTAT